MDFERNVLIENIDKLHTTPLGAVRICRNLKVNCEDAAEYCKSLILAKDCRIYRQGKNWYCEAAGIRITVNASSYTIITAHPMKGIKQYANQSSNC